MWLFNFSVEYMCHVYVRADGLAAVLVTDAEYPHRVSHTLLTKTLDDAAVSLPDWKTANTETYRSYKGKLDRA